MRLQVAERLRLALEQEAVPPAPPAAAAHAAVARPPPLRAVGGRVAARRAHAAAAAAARAADARGVARRRRPFEQLGWQLGEPRARVQQTGQDDTSLRVIVVVTTPTPTPEAGLNLPGETRRDAARGLGSAVMAVAAPRLM